ncbi:MAG TPA: hypothetical protein VHK27_05325, partial [Gammaproteobacteria bacterium]|nr:hypothetical protein [Gammaproteobacteria bacterium]
QNLRRPLGMEENFIWKLCLQTPATLLESLCKRQGFELHYRRMLERDGAIIAASLWSNCIGPQMNML